MRYSCKQVPLPNGAFDWVPMLAVQLSRGSFLTPHFEALIDSGAFDCLFHGDIAAAVGIPDITTGVLKKSGGVAKGAEITTYGHEVRLIIGSDSFKVEAYFCRDLPIAALLGRNGFFDKYIVTFDPSGNVPGFGLQRAHRR